MEARTVLVILFVYCTYVLHANKFQTERQTKGKTAIPEENEQPDVIFIFGNASNAEEIDRQLESQKSAVKEASTTTRAQITSGASQLKTSPVTAEPSKTPATGDENKERQFSLSWETGSPKETTINPSTAEKLTKSESKLGDTELVEVPVLYEYNPEYYYVDDYESEENEVKNAESAREQIEEKFRALGVTRQFDIVTVPPTSPLPPNSNLKIADGASSILSSNCRSIPEFPYWSCVTKEKSTLSPTPTPQLLKPPGSDGTAHGQKTLAQKINEPKPPSIRPRDFHVHGSETFTGDPEEKAGKKHVIFIDGQAFEIIVPPAHQTSEKMSQGSAIVANPIATDNEVHEVLPVVESEVTKEDTKTEVGHKPSEAESIEDEKSVVYRIDEAPGEKPEPKFRPVKPAEAVSVGGHGFRAQTTKIPTTDGNQRIDWAQQPQFSAEVANERAFAKKTIEEERTSETALIQEALNKTKTSLENGQRHINHIFKQFNPITHRIVYRGSGEVPTKNKSEEQEETKPHAAADPTLDQSANVAEQKVGNENYVDENYGNYADEDENINSFFKVEFPDGSEIITSEFREILTNPVAEFVEYSEIGPGSSEERPKALASKTFEAEAAESEQGAVIQPDEGLLEKNYDYYYEDYELPALEFHDEQPLSDSLPINPIHPPTTTQPTLVDIIIHSTKTPPKVLPAAHGVPRASVVEPISLRKVDVNKTLTEFAHLVVEDPEYARDQPSSDTLQFSKASVEQNQVFRSEIDKERRVQNSDNKALAINRHTGKWVHGTLSHTVHERPPTACRRFRSRSKVLAAKWAYVLGILDNWINYIVQKPK